MHLQVLLFNTRNFVLISQLVQFVEVPEQVVQELSQLIQVEEAESQTFPLAQVHRPPIRVRVEPQVSQVVGFVQVAQLE